MANHTRSKRPRRFPRLHLVAAASFVALQVTIAPPASAGAPITCQINGTTATVVLLDTINGLRITRVGQDIVFGEPSLDGQACGTVTTIDKVNVDGQGTADVIFNLSGGHFAPGVTDEMNVSSEIEFNISDVFEDYQLSVYGTNDDDGLTVGSVLFRPDFVSGAVVNLNALLDGATPDGDVSIRGIPDFAQLTPRWGDDVVSGQGIGGLGLTDPASFPLVVYDSLGSDTVTGGFGDDYISPDVNGNDGFDTGDTFSGGAGVDTLDMTFKGRGSNVTLDDVRNDGASCPGLDCENDQVHSDFEHIIGTSQNDRLSGGPGAQTLDGGPGNNVLIGGPGADVLDAEAGRDVFRGGKGLDVVLYDHYDHRFGVTVTLDGEADDGLPGELDNVRGDVEGVVGASGNDRIVGNGKSNYLSGYTGDDVLVGAGGNDHLDLYTYGGRQEGSDVLRGGSGVDTVYANALGGPVDLTIDGLANDVAIGAPDKGVDDIRPDVENLVGGSYDDRLTGNGAGNRLVGSFGNDTLVGLGGNDVLLPGLGIDSLKGGLGEDTASYADAFAAITATLAQGTATGDGDDSFVKLERLVGSDFDDSLTGSGAANVLTGGAGSDMLAGLAGNDRLLGGGGDDVLNGGSGSDTCKQGSGSGSQSSCEN